MTGPERALALLQREAGGHRWQRIPPNEKAGRVQTSTVTVAVIQPGKTGIPLLRDEDIDMKFSKSSGPGGQHRNKTESAVTLTHRPTNLQGQGTGRCQHTNRRIAREMLEARVHRFYAEQERRNFESNRKAQVGTGQRGDKIRTYALQNDIVQDHLSGKKVSVRRILAGDLELLQ